MALFDSSHVIDGLEAADQDAVFEALAQKAVELGVTSDASAVVADLRAREGEASTGFGDGIAIPHAKSPNVTAPSIVFARLGAGVEWNALDGEPVDTVINILVRRAAATPCSFLPSWRETSSTRTLSQSSSRIPPRTYAP